MSFLRCAYSAARISSLALLSCLVGCGASDVPLRQGGGTGGVVITGGTGGNISTGGGAGTGTGNQTGGSIVTGTPDAGSGQGCQNLQVVFEPKIPTVFVLVDRSGSMFDSMVWAPLRTGVLNILQATQADIRYGFAAFTGLAGVTCPIFDGVPIAQNNYTAIATLYNRLDRAMVNGMVIKAETPTTMALAQVGDVLKSDTAPGDKFILFVTDGEPDFCDDSNHICAVDSVVHELQSLKQAGITTIVMGLKSTASDISLPSMQAFANAGAGQPVLAPPTIPTPAPLNIFYQCNSVPGWVSDLAAAGKMGMTSIGAYGATSGTATLYNPDLTNVDAGQSTLVQQLTSAIAGVKSCTFDLSGKIEVDLNQLGLASVSIEGRAVPLDQSNGWRMNTTTQLELVGDACATWRKPENTHIDFNFPCGVIIIK